MPGYFPPAMPVPTTVALQQNPAFIAVADKEYLWNQLVDVIDDYFKIDREQRVRQVGDLQTEGRIDTLPRPGATLLEPWEHDSVTFDDRLESTLQSIRRHATVRVVPTEGGYLVDVAVFKELEDLKQPELGFIGRFYLRNDDSLRRLAQPVGGEEPTEGWISQGRDVGLEQRILAQAAIALGHAPAGAGLLVGLKRLQERTILLKSRVARPAKGVVVGRAHGRCLTASSERSTRLLWHLRQRGQMRDRRDEVRRHGGRQPQRECRSLADGAFDADPPMMGFDHVAAEGESQASAAFAGGVGSALRREEAVEDSRQLVSRNAAAGVADREVDHACGRIVAQSQRDLAALLHRLPRVDQQVQQDLLHLVRVDERWRHRLKLRLDADAVFYELAFDQHQRVVDQFEHVGRLLLGRCDCEQTPRCRW